MPRSTGPYHNPADVLNFAETDLGRGVLAPYLKPLPKEHGRGCAGYNEGRSGLKQQKRKKPASKAKPKYAKHRAPHPYRARGGLGDDAADAAHHFVSNPVGATYGLAEHVGKLPYRAYGHAAKAVRGSRGVTGGRAGCGSCGLEE